MVIGLLAKSPKLSPQTEFGIPPWTAMLPRTIGSGGYIFVVSFHELIFFDHIILNTCEFFSIKLLYRSTGEIAETQSTDWVWYSALDRHVAKNNWQRRVYFRGEFSWTHLFSPYYTHHTSIFFQLNGYRSTGEIAETQSTDWVWHSALDRHVAKNNWQRRVYFCGEFAWTHLFWPYYTQHMWIFFN